MFPIFVAISFRTFHGGGYGGYQSTPNIPQGVASMEVDLPGAPNKKKARPLVGYERENRHCLAILLFIITQFNFSGMPVSDSLKNVASYASLCYHCCMSSRWLVVFNIFINIFFSIAKTSIIKILLHFS